LLLANSGNALWNDMYLFLYGRFCSNRFGLLDESVRERSSRISQKVLFGR